MDQSIKRRWVRALRSGKYQQGKDFLRREGKKEDLFCCLGVLCDLYEKEKELNGWRSNEIFNGREVIKSYLGVGNVLPEHVKEWSGLSSVDGGFVKFGAYPEGLATLNDRGIPFDALADLIEEQL